MQHRFLINGALLLAVASLALAGPPLICHPHDIGSAKSLPWRNDGTNKWDNPDPKYPVQQLSADTLGLLQPGVPVIVRAETLRRAAVYGQQDHAAASELLAALRRRSESSADPMASFDYGCFLTSLQQMKYWYKADLTAGVNGMAYLKTAQDQTRDPAIGSIITAAESYK